VDKKKLAAIPIHIESNPPATEGEEALARVWADVLKQPYDSIQRETTFFELGGDSLSAIRMVALAKSQANLSLTVAQVFQTPELQRLAATTQAEAVAIPDVIVRYTLSIV
jgi:acyl carrier protein